jgi:7-carboxy-7-deazaguanine synthase
MRINEIYHSLQGESTHAGRSCTFIRLTYCNLRCTYCDSEFAFFEGKEMSVEEVLSAVRTIGERLVEITGGEPLLQEEVYPLMSRLLEEDFSVLLETSGCVEVGRVDPRVIKIMDLKCPGSGESHRNLPENLDKLQPHDEVKFVIGNREDYLWARQMVEQHRLGHRFTVLFSTVFGVLPPRQLVEWVLEDHLPVRFQLQLHKYIWDPETRGV